VGDFSRFVTKVCLADGVSIAFVATTALRKHLKRETRSSRQSARRVTGRCDPSSVLFLSLSLSLSLWVSVSKEDSSQGLVHEFTY
jgi:hypothetical protein